MPSSSLSIHPTTIPWPNANCHYHYCALVIIVGYLDDGSGARGATEGKVPGVEDIEEEEEAEIR